MIRTRHAWLVFIGAMLVTGCNGTTGPSSGSSDTMTDSEEIGKMIDEELADYFPSDFMEEGGSVSKSAEAIAADRWWREITERTGNVNVDFPGDGSAAVTVRRYVAGILHLVAEVDSAITTEYEKAFADSIVRYAVFRRLPVAESRPPFRRWYLESISFGEATSTPVNSVQIASVSIENLESGYTQTYTDPAALLDRETEIPAFGAGEEIAVTIAGSVAGLDAFLHTNHQRLSMTDNGDGTYGATYVVPARLGPRWVGVELLSGGTLGDNASDYDNNAWATHYRVE